MFKFLFIKQGGADAKRETFRMCKKTFMDYVNFTKTTKLFLSKLLEFTVCTYMANNLNCIYIK